MDDMYDKMRRQSDVRRVDAENRIRTRSDKSKGKFADIVSKKFQTTFIGALSAFEKEFGHLWGNDKKPADRTPQEQEYYRRWQQVRTVVLNNGNNNARAVLNELRQYSMTWQGYSMDFHVGENNDKG